MKYFLAFVLFMSAAPPIPSLYGQRSPEAMTLGGQRFEIGMSKEEALAELSMCCSIAPAAPAPHSWSVKTSGPPFESLGFIWFAKGKVSMVEQSHGQFQQADAVNLAQSLFRIISADSRSKSEATITQTDTTEGSNLTIRTVTLRFGSGRSVVLTINKVDPNRAKMGDWVEINERLENP